MPSAPIPRQSPRRGLRAGLAVLLGLSTMGGVALGGVQPAAAANQLTAIKPQAMAYTNTALPNANYGSAARLVFSKSQYKTFLRYNTSTVSAKSNIVSAELDLSITKSAATLPGIEVRRTSAGWTSSTITDAKRPSIQPAVLNPRDAVVPRANSKITVKLPGLAGKPVSSAMGLQLTYAVARTAINLNKSVPPVLRLVTAPAPVNAATLPTTGSSTELPYTPASTGTTKKVFAHYFPPYPISIDNKATALDYYSRNYLNPLGENGKFQSVGGLLRDRPMSRPVLTGDYKMTDAITEVRQASANGLDGFLTNIMGRPGTSSWDASVRLSQAAASSGTGFVVAPNVDMTGSIASATAPELANMLAQFYKTNGSYRLPDGRYVLSTFKAEGKSVTYWRELITALKTQHNIQVAWVGIFLGLSDAQIAAYAPISYAMGIWGARDAASVLNMPKRAAVVHQYGVKWMAPIAVQDVRHTSLSFAESGNTDLLRASWQRAIADNSDFAQLVTWNDYSESSGFAPSASHRNAFLDISGYYTAQFKSGMKPTLKGDELVVTHRIQKTTLRPALQTAPMVSTLAGSKTARRDTVEVMSFLRTPADVTLTVGGTTKTVAAPAGLSQFTLPLTPGSVSAKATRGGQTVATVTSPNKVVSSINYWNLQYYAASSRENPTP